MIRLIVKNIPSIVLAIMIITCVVVDVAVIHEPRMLVAQLPIIIITILYPVINNSGRFRGKTGV